MMSTFMDFHLFTARTNIQTVETVSILILRSKPLRDGHVAAPDMWRDDRDKASEWRLHLRSIDHLVVWSSVESQKRNERFTGFVCFADVALLFKEKGR